MTTELAGRLRRLGSACAALPAAGAACTGPQHMLDPTGPQAARIAELWWVMFALATAISIVTIVLLGVAVARARRRERGEPVRDIDGMKLVIGGGMVLPVVVVFGLLLYSLPLGSYVRLPPAAPGEPLHVEVVGHQFWWQVRYPQLGIETANEIWIPTGRAVRVRLSSPDVIHSFWVPRLHGKMDMTPGRVTVLWLRADEPGAYRGQCAEYCGRGHALMAFWVNALPAEQFEAWAAHLRGPAAEPPGEQIARGRAVFAAAGCDACHTTRGAPLPPELGAPGPDLTNLAQRRTLAAGTLPNTRAQLARWILDPQGVKPGNRMPPTVLDTESLDALVSYLMSLGAEE